MPGGVQAENLNLAQQVMIAIVVFKEESLSQSDNSAKGSRRILLSESENTRLNVLCSMGSPIFSNEA
jgi:hypothetical protein